MTGCSCQNHPCSYKTRPSIISVKTLDVADKEPEHDVTGCVGIAITPTRMISEQADVMDTKKKEALEIV